MEASEPTTIDFWRMGPQNAAERHSNTNHPWLYRLSLLVTFHVLVGLISTKDIFDGTRLSIPPLAKAMSMPIKQNNDTIDDGASTLTGSDITVSNGYIHIPDRVLIPPFMKILLGSLLFDNHNDVLELEQNLHVTAYTKMMTLPKVEASQIVTRPWLRHLCYGISFL